MVNDAGYGGPDRIVRVLLSRGRGGTGKVVSAGPRLGVVTIHDGPEPSNESELESRGDGVNMGVGTDAVSSEDDPLGAFESIGFLELRCPPRLEPVTEWAHASEPKLGVGDPRAPVGVTAATVTLGTSGLSLWAAAPVAVIVVNTVGWPALLSGAQLYVRTRVGAPRLATVGVTTVTYAGGYHALELTGGSLDYPLTRAAEDTTAARG